MQVISSSPRGSSAATWGLALATKETRTAVGPCCSVTPRSSNHALNSGPVPMYRMRASACPRFSTNAKGREGEPGLSAALAALAGDAQIANKIEAAEMWRYVDAFTPC